MGAVALVPFALHRALPRHDTLSGYAANLWSIVTWGAAGLLRDPRLGAWDAWTMETRFLGVRRFMELGYPNRDRSAWP